jgi:aquaporin Z
MSAWEELQQSMAPYGGEFLGTFALLFAGTGAVVINDASGGSITQVGIAITFGLIVMTMIYAVGDLSGAHLNPAVSVGFWLSGQLSLRTAVGYVVAQVAGGISASAMLRAVFPEHTTLGATLPNLAPFGAFAFEVLLTFFLMFVIIHVSVGAKEKGLMAGVAVGGMVCLSAMYGGPATGASMNPARSLAPALVAGQWRGWWIYVTAPFIGSALAVLSCRLLRYPGCCGSDQESCN